MYTSFSGIEIGLRALLTHKQVLDVTGHNIANAATPGYSRQQVSISATEPWARPDAYNSTSAGQVGTGVNLDSIQRVRDAFLDDRFRQATAAAGDWGIQRDTITEIESLLGEPSDTGLRAILDELWASFYELANNPENLAARSSVVERATILTDSYNRMHEELVNMRASADLSIRAKVDAINSLTDQIATLNADIVRIRATGKTTSDLLDRRDALVDDLAKIVDLTVREEGDGSLSVALGGGIIVAGPDAFELEPVDNPANSGFADIVWEGGIASARMTGGELAGYFTARDDVIPRVMDGLNTLLTSISNEINLLHQAGFDLNGNPGVAFFVPGAYAPLLEVNPALRADVRLVAASAAGAPGDGAQANALGKLQHQPICAGTTPGDYYNSLVAQVGILGQDAAWRAESSDILALQSDNHRRSLAGVSLDEEAAMMIKFQQAYNAAARYVTAVDEMLDKVVNDLGVVGR